MLNGEKVRLRSRHDDDVPILHEELYNDVATHSRADGRAWRPIPPGSAASPYIVNDSDEKAACFSVLQIAGDELAGEALLWGIDAHNRSAHVGLALRPAFRGRGLAIDVVRVLCRYGFAVRGLWRLQIETLADNSAMLGTAAGAGFTREGLLRKAAWVDGAFVDEVVLGLLADDWKAQG